MATVERRKKRRVPDVVPGSVFVEIDHSYGPHKTSVYEVVELDEQGLSFLVPFDEGYFLPGTPLRFSITQQDKFKTKHVGIARYHHPVYTEEGEKFNKIGVEIRSSLRHPPRTKYVLRPPRLSTGRRRTFVISMHREGETFRFEIIDFSKYSAAFHCEEEHLLFFGVSSVLSDVKIFLDSQTIFEGEVTVTRVYTDRSGRNRVIVEPKSATIDVDSVQKFEMVSTATRETGDLIRRHDSFQNIDSTFKAMVADLRFFLEDFKDYLESPIFQAERREPGELLEEIFPLFNEKMDSKVTRLDLFTRELALVGEEEHLYKQYYQKNLLPLFVAAPYNHRVFFKPQGYPGDFEMIRMVHGNRFEGSSLFGKLINKYSTNIPVARVVRERTEYFRDLIGRTAEGNRSLRIFSVASGPAMEFDLLFREHPHLADTASITLLDQEIEALEFSMDVLYGHKARSGSTVNINFLHQSLGNYLRKVARGKVAERYDLIYASGLFDYFDFKTSSFVIRKLLSLLDPGGRLVIANLSLEGHDHRIFMEFGHEWHLIYRTKEDMVKLAGAVGEISSFDVREISRGILKILEIER